MAAEPSFDRGISYDLHVLVGRLDRDADRILRAELDLSYPKFLTLITLRRTGPVTQRALADELGLTEPTVSRGVGALAEAGLVSVTSTAGAGNRRSVALTDGGRSQVDKSADRLEAAFGDLLRAADVDPALLRDLTTRLLTVLGR
jgi:DNA-binding MarR family transcriptional regulator